jgi:hypothetical protein
VTFSLRRGPLAPCDSFSRADIASSPAINAVPTAPSVQFVVALRPSDVVSVAVAAQRVLYRGPNKIFHTLKAHLAARHLGVLFRELHPHGAEEEVCYVATSSSVDGGASPENEDPVPSAPTEYEIAPLTTEQNVLVTVSG